MIKSVCRAQYHQCWVPSAAIALLGSWLEVGVTIYSLTEQPACIGVQKMCVSESFPLIPCPHLPLRLLALCFYLALHLPPTSHTRVLPSTLALPPRTDLISTEPHSLWPCHSCLWGRSTCFRTKWGSCSQAGRGDRQLSSHKAYTWVGECLLLDYRPRILCKMIYIIQAPAL